MLSKQDLLLVLDANALLDILCANQNWKQALDEWFKHTIESMKYIPTGKTITFMISTRILCDYKTALGSNKYKNASNITMQMKKLMTKKQLILKKQKITYTIMIVNPDTSSPQLVRDKYDNMYPELIQEVRSRSRWRDRYIIMATRDKKTYDDLRDLCIRSDPNNSKVVNDKSMLEDEIRCEKH